MNKYILKVDSSDLKNKKVVLLNDKSIFIDEIVSDKDLIEITELLLSRNDVTFDQIYEVIPTNVGGSLSGTKVDITFANIFNFGKGSNKQFRPNYGREPNITLKKF